MFDRELERKDDSYSNGELGSKVQPIPHCFYYDSFSVEPVPALTVNFESRSSQGTERLPGVLPVAA
jgi:hypothetical protein